MIGISDFVRFMRLVQVGAETGSCWIWLGNKPDGRYGHFSIKGQAVKAHRWLYELLNGPIPDGLVIRHHCDNPQCVNPDHLAVGTPAQNTADMLSRGRGADRRGEKHPLVRLTEEDVRTIRELRAGGATEAALAARYGVGRGQIGKITRRENWKHVA